MSGAAHLDDPLQCSKEDLHTKGGQPRCTNADQLSIAELMEFMNDDLPLLPLPLPPMPVRPSSSSARVRSRYKGKLQVWREACKLFVLVNGLSIGTTEQNNLKTSHATQARSSVGDRMKVSSTASAASLASARLLNRAAELVRARRSLATDLTGVHGGRKWACTSALLTASSDDCGYLKLPSFKQVSLHATNIVEPDPNIQPIDMLQKLPYDDAIFYSHEENVLDRAGKSQAMANDIEKQYCFVGGSEDEYISYMSLDRAKPLWHWSLAKYVKAYAGLAAVLKKDGVSQRKLLMQCVANYWFCDVSTRSCLGMHGGSALARCHAADGKFHVSSCDEDASFTFI